MINELRPGVFRVRHRYGFIQRYRALKRKVKLTKKETLEIKNIKLKFGNPPVQNTRRSAVTSHLWQAKDLAARFKKAHDLEALGLPVPKDLLKYKICPPKNDLVEELVHLMLSITRKKEELIYNLDFLLFLEQADIDLNWLASLHVSEEMIKKEARAQCMESATLNLKDKTFLFTGAVTGNTGSPQYLGCLRTLGLKLKVDGILTSGEWIKSIFLHKTSNTKNSLKELKDLVKSVPVYALRSNRDHADHIQELKKIGITFFTEIQDEKNIFLGTRLSRGSTKDQLKRYERAYLGKNIFVYTTYVGMRSQAIKGGGLRYLIGSGSSGYNTPSARVWSAAHDSQAFNSSIRDNIGGHVLRFDSESNCFPTTFRYHEGLKAILFGGKAYYPKKVQQGELHLVLSDFHAMAHHRLAFSAFLKFISDHKSHIKTLALNGDFFDNMVLCHHNRGKFSEQIALAKRDLDVLKEVAFTKACLKLIISKLSSHTKRIYKMGNHEVNSIRSFLNRDLNHFLESMLDIEVLLNLPSMGFKVIKSKDTYTVGEMEFYHGHEIKRTSAGRMLGSNSVGGHSHTLDIGPDGMILPGMEDTRKTHYLSNQYTDWAVGAGVITEFKKCSVLPQPLLINHEGKYADFKTIKQVRTETKIKLPKKIDIQYDINWTGREAL